MLVAKNGWRLAVEGITSENEMVQRAAMELLCNLCASDAALDGLAEKCQKVSARGGGIGCGWWGKSARGCSSSCCDAQQRD